MKYSLEIATSLENAYELWKKTNGTYLAAGTVILVNHKHNSTLISLEKIPGLSEIEETENCIYVGANVTFDDIENSKLLKEKTYALWLAAASVGGPQIRNRATLGGNVGCFSVSSDGVTPLIALGAKAEVFNGKTKEEISVENLEPFSKGEIITRFIIPKTVQASIFEKVGRRNALAVSQINMAIARCENTIRVAVGSAGPKVVLCDKTSDLLTNGLTSGIKEGLINKISASIIEEAKKLILTEIAPRKESAEYKNEVCVNLLEKLLKEVDK